MKEEMSYYVVTKDDVAVSIKHKERIRFYCTETRVCVPPLDQTFFIFMQLSETFRQIIDWQPLRGWPHRPAYPSFVTAVAQHKL